MNFLNITDNSHHVCLQEHIITYSGMSSKSTIITAEITNIQRIQKCGCLSHNIPGGLISVSAVRQVHSPF